MKINTFTIVVGSLACNARCPYCVSKMTPNVGMDMTPPTLNYRNLDIACRFAAQNGVSTALITGKGEPMLFPSDLVAVNSYLNKHFPFIELQTNGINLQKYKPIMKGLYDNGMTTVSLSVAHYDAGRNADIICPDLAGFDFWATSDWLHDIGFSVRVNCTVTKKFGDFRLGLMALMQQAKKHGVEQLTVRPVTKPDQCSNEVAFWIEEHPPEVPPSHWAKYLEDAGATMLLDLPHGGRVYDYQGQNVCLNNCLTESSDPNNIRQLIYFPDGHLRYSWQHQGAVIL